MACLSKFSPDTHNTPTTFDEPSLSLSRIATRTRNEKKKKKNLKNSRRCGLCEYAGVMLMWIEMSKLANRRKRESCLRCGFYVFLILSVGFSRRTSIASVIYYKLESNMHPPMNHWTFSFSIFFIFVFCSRNTIDFAANTSWWFKQFSFIFGFFASRIRIERRETKNNALETTVKRSRNGKIPFGYVKCAHKETRSLVVRLSIGN